MLSPTWASLLPVALAIGVGGALGALSRFATAAAATQWLGNGWPLGTLIANLLGCLLLGYLRPWALVGGPGWWVAGLTTGFCGAYTTFSTFSVEAVELSRTGGVRAAALYVGASVIGGLVFVLVGMRLGGGGPA